MSSWHNNDVRLAKKIEAGVLAQELLDGPTRSQIATEEELAALVSEGHQASDELVLSHMGLVHVIAAEAYRSQKMPYVDILQEGCLAMQRAVMSYDWRKGPFGPYAGLWIRSAVRRLSSRPWFSLEGVDPEDVTHSQAWEHAVIHEGLSQILDHIPALQRTVLQLRSGWDGHPHTRAAIASELGMSTARVRYLERVGLQSMRQEWDVAEVA
jgi:RNA polymerase sigma factor (sigma-70 family)